MTIIIFIIVLGILVFVHELGHFLVAKKAGIRVDEFGIGFPPRIAGIKRGETVYSINLIPFGGFVKIFGEQITEEAITGPDSERSFIHKSRSWQAAVLVAGVFFNMLFAWLLISLGFIIGLPTPIDHESFGEVKDAHLVITNIVPESPAADAGIKPGDVVTKIVAGEIEFLPSGAHEASRFIEEHQEMPLEFSFLRGEEVLTVTVEPEEGIIEGRRAVGVMMDMIGTLKLNPYLALIEGARTTANLTAAISLGLVDFIGQIVTGRADFAQVAGPIGIAGLVGDASRLGIVYLLSFVAFISIHLAIINLVPFPALDGGRLLFVAIEGLTKKKIPPKVFNWVNAIGFALLLLLMLVVTYQDILRLL